MVADATQSAAGPQIGIDTGRQHPAMLSAQLCAEACGISFDTLKNTTVCQNLVMNSITILSRSDGLATAPSR